MVKRVDRSTGEVTDVQVPFLRSSYSDHAAFSDSFGLRCDDESLTSQSFKDECDINTIVRRFGLTGLLPRNVRAPVSGDFTGISSFEEAMHAVLAAKRSFGEMPADVRSEFGNDPARFVEFCSDPANRGRMGELGLLTPEAFQAYLVERQAAEAADLESRALEAGFVRPELSGLPPAGGGKGG